jgi:hypothetical protein
MHEADMSTDETRRNRTATGSREAPAAAPTAAEKPSVPVEATPASAPQTTSTRDVADFLARMKTLAPATGVGRGRLVFAMDATMSRQPTWDMALGLQAEMFRAVKEVGTLDVQLVYFRGAGECRASKWVADAEALSRLMTTVSCQGGYTQIAKVLSHARQETERRKISALVYVGDCMEEGVDELCGRAGELALHGVPVFLFQEGHDATAEQTFREIARITKGAFCRFDAGAAGELRDLLTAVAVYAAGGRQALARLADGGAGRRARLLLEQLR